MLLRKMQAFYSPFHAFSHMLDELRKVAYTGLTAFGKENSFYVGK